LDNIIKRVLNTEEIPKPSKKYEIPNGRLNIDPEDLEIFKELFSPSGIKKGIGKGEISLYWLFNPNSIQNDVYSGADLILNGKYVEVKSYPSNKKMVTLGSIGEDKEMRLLINTLFGLRNIFISKKQKIKKPFLTEVGFRVEDLGNSLAFYGVLKRIFQKHKISMNKYPLFKNACYSCRKIDYILKHIGIKDSDNINTQLVKILKRFIGRKLAKKPGWGQYIVNIDPKDLDIIFHKVPERQELLSNELNVYVNNFVIDFSKIRLNFKEFLD